MKSWIVPIVVILYPYRGIDYEEPTLYIIKQSKPLEIEEVLGDGYEDRLFYFVESEFERLLKHDLSSNSDRLIYAFDR